MIKNKDYYLNIDYDIIVSKLSESDGGGYFAYYKDIDTVMGDGETEDEAVKDVKSAFSCYLDISLANKDAIPEPEEKLNKAKRVNISLTNRHLIGLDLMAKKYSMNRSKLISKLTDLLLNGDINLNKA
jgi:predicted RNase H-like HicB family nuclease